MSLGPHPGLKRLIAYRQGTLPAAERDAVQEHLSLCARCTELLLELRNFETDSARGDAGPEPLRQEAWASLSQRLPGKAATIRPVAGAGQLATRRQRMPRWIAGLAAALLLAVLGISAWAAVTVQQERRRLARLERQLEEREEALAAARSSLAEAESQLAKERERIEPAGRVEELKARVAELTTALEELRRTAKAPEARDRTAAAAPPIAVSIAPLFALRSQERPDFLRGGGAVSSVPLQEDRIGFKLSLAEQPVYGEYRFELSDRDGQVLWTGRRPGRSLLGDAGTTVSIQGLGPGRYTLRIEGLRPDRTDLLAVYLLETARTGES